MNDVTTSEAGPEAPEAPSSRGPLLWIGATLIGLVAITVILLVVRSPAEFEPGTPEAVVQDYLQAVLDGDTSTALELLAADSDCSRDDFIRFRDEATNVRITLTDTTDLGDEALVDVRIRYDDVGLDELSSYDLDESFTLLAEDGDWRITGAPWPLFFCERPA